MVGDGLIEDGAATEDGAPAMLSRLTTRSLTPFSERRQMDDY